jgi:hypothetical protein
VSEEVPGLAAFVEDVGVAVEDGDGELVLAQILPDVLDRIELRSIGRQVQKGDVVGHVEIVCSVPTRPIEDEDGVRPRGDLAGDLGQVQGQAVGVGLGQDESGGCGPRGANGAEDVGPFVAPVAWAARPAPASGPDPCQRPLLADPGLILKPDLDRLAARGRRDRRGYLISEVFLKAAWAASSAFG